MIVNVNFVNSARRLISIIGTAHQLRDGQFSAALGGMWDYCDKYGFVWVIRMYNLSAETVPVDATSFVTFIMTYESVKIGWRGLLITPPYLPSGRHSVRFVQRQCSDGHDRFAGNESLEVLTKYCNKLELS